MAKAAKKTAAKKNGGAKTEKPEFGVPEMAKFLGLGPATVRGKLRSSNLKKTGKAWSWPSRAAMEKDGKKLQAA